MKTLLLIFAFWLGLLNCYAQNNGFAAYRAKDYPTAIKLYQADLSKKESVYERSMLALCYENLDSIPQSIREYEKVANTKQRDFLANDLASQASEKLNRYFQSQKNFQQALYYVQLNKAIVEQAKFNDMNWARYHFFNANEQAKCFAALGQIDSAIRVLTPNMFFSYHALEQMMFIVEGYKGNKLDSLKHDTVSRFYFSLLQKRYTKAQIKAEFEKAEQSFIYTQNQQPVDKYGYSWVTMECTIHIYGIDVVIIGRHFGKKEAQLPKELQTPYFTKEYQLAQFRELPICRMVRGL